MSRPEKVSTCGETLVALRAWEWLFTRVRPSVNDERSLGWKSLVAKLAGERLGVVPPVWSQLRGGGKLLFTNLTDVDGHTGFSLQGDYSSTILGRLLVIWHWFVNYQLWICSRRPRCDKDLVLRLVDRWRVLVEIHFTITGMVIKQTFFLMLKSTVDRGRKVVFIKRQPKELFFHFRWRNGTEQIFCKKVSKKTVSDFNCNDS